MVALPTRIRRWVYHYQRPITILTFEEDLPDAKEMFRQFRENYPEFQELVMPQETETTVAETFLERAEDTNVWAQVPTHTKAAILDYLNRDYRPGGFMYAVLTNDLKGAVMRADHKNKAQLVWIVAALYEYAPSFVWGSEEAVQKYLEGED